MQFEKNLQPLQRVASIAAGVGLIAWSANRGKLRRLVTPIGVSLIARGGSGYCPVTDAFGRGRVSADTRQALGGSNGVNVHESITILADRTSIYNVWKQPYNLATLMPSVERVDDLGNGWSHWVVAGPAGATVEWDAELINDIPGRLIAWRSLPGGEVATAGSVHFDDAGQSGTRVTVRLQYDPPAGKAGAAVANAFGTSPNANIREGLRHLKAAFEAGEVPTGAGRPDEERRAIG